MAEFNGIPPVGNSSVVRPAPMAPPPAVPGVEASLKGGGLSGRMDAQGRAPGPGRTGLQSSGTADEDRPRQADRDQLAGPSPAFQASVLELELDLQNTIARVEAARGKRESEMAGMTAGGRDTADADKPKETAAPGMPGPDEAGMDRERGAELPAPTTELTD